MKITKETFLYERQKGFSLVETVFALTLFSLILSLSITPFKNKSFQKQVADQVFMNQLKGAITQQRIRAAREHSLGYSFVLNGTGSVRFTYSGKDYFVIDDPVYRVNLPSGQWTSILTTTDFKNRTSQGQNGFSIYIYRKDQLMGKLIFQVATSTFREEYYGPS